MNPIDSGDAVSPALVRRLRAAEPDASAGRRVARRSDIDPAPSTRRADGLPTAADASKQATARASVPVSVPLTVLARLVGASVNTASLADLAARAAAFARLAGPLDLDRLVRAASRDPGLARALAGILAPDAPARAADGAGRAPVGDDGTAGQSVGGEATTRGAAGVLAQNGRLPDSDIPSAALARCVMRFLRESGNEPAGAGRPADAPPAETLREALHRALGSGPHLSAADGAGVAGDVTGEPDELALELVRRAFRAEPAHAASGLSAGGRTDGREVVELDGPAVPAARAGPRSTADSVAVEAGRSAERPAAPADVAQVLRALLGAAEASSADRLARLLANLARLDPSATASNLVRRATADPAIADALRRLLDAGPGSTGASPAIAAAAQPSDGDAASRVAAFSADRPGTGMPPGFDDTAFIPRGTRTLGLDLAQRDPRLLVPLFGMLASLAGAANPAELIEMAGRDRRARRRLRRSLTGGADGFADSSEALADAIDDARPPVASSRAKRLRVWNAACGEGMDAYGIAIAALDRGIPDSLEVLATDSDGETLVEARRGRYRLRDVDGLPAEIRARFFVGAGGGRDAVEVSPNVRRMVSFRRHDLVAQSIGDRFDIVVCRGVLWALSAPAAARAIGHLVEAVRVGGILVVGEGDPAVGAGDVLPLGNGRYVRVAGPGRTIDVEA